MEEIWKPIPGLNGYEASNLGRIRSTKRVKTRILKPARQQCGHLGVNLSINGPRIFRRVHQLVMLAFVGPYPSGLEICHNDGNPTNNRLDNLRYDTHASNIIDMVKHNGGVHPLAKFRPKLTKKPTGKPTKLTMQQQKEIREIYAQGDIFMPDLAEKYNITASAVCLGINGKRWLNAGGPIKGIDY